ncbi:hypothetical protein [Malonomonas rubra]|uniref:hypothetical protein n=1 Tax=Malonomonas rubra TaxID=57040 RepID=UPI0026F336AF|nr:hypothetical protein [Malonomonas rubra]
MRRSRILLSGLAALTVLSACTNQDAAQLGSLIGRSLGKPVGTVATAIDETFRTVGDVVNENPRFQNQYNEPKQTVSSRIPSTEEDYYYKAEVLVKTRGPAQIDSMSLQKTEDVSDFWK